MMLTAQTLVQPVLAQQINPQGETQFNESSITAIPPRLGEDLSLTAKPGEKIQTSVRVRNGSSQTLTISSIAQDFIVDTNGQTPIAINDSTSNRWSLASWMLLTPSVQEIEPGQTAVVNVVIEVPDDALPGGHYAMITHQPNAGGGVDKKFTIGRAGSSTLKQRVGTLVYLKVEGPINEAAFIRNLKFPKFTEYGPVPFSFAVDNQSDIHLRPQVGVEIYNFFGQKVDTIQFETKNVFPFIARNFEGEWDRIWGFGKYTAKVVMSYGSNGQVAIVSTSFWLLPVTLLLAGLIVLLALTAIIIVVRRHFLHKQGDEQTKIAMLEEKVKQLEEQKLEKFDN
jgi:hypothetical protein